MGQECAIFKQPLDGRSLRAFIALLLLFVSQLRAQDALSTPGGNASSGETVEEVIVTGSNIPTSEEVGPLPVDTYRRVDLERLGARSATEFIQKIPAVMGASTNENSVNGGDGRTEINLRGILPKETLVLQDGRRLAPVGFAGDTVDLNIIPVGLIDHIDILKDGASAIYGADAVDGVFNVWLIHRFRGLEISGSYGNTNSGFANDQHEQRYYLLAGTGDDKTDIVVYAEFYDRGAIFARDVDISHNTDFTEFGGLDSRSGNFAGRVGGFVFQPRLNGGARTPTPHSSADAKSSPEYIPITSVPRERRFFNFGDLAQAMGQSDRQYFYGSFDRKLCDEYLEVFADFKYVRSFWEGGLAAAPFSPDVFTDQTHPLGISPTGLSVPTQNAFNPFTVPDYISLGGFDPKIPGTVVSAAPIGTQFITGVRYRALEAGLRTDKITTDNYVFTGGMKGSLGGIGDYFKTWTWETGFRYSEDHRIERFGGIANTNVLRAALLDTNTATAFNPFGINQNRRETVNRIFLTTNHIGTTSLTLEDVKLNGDLFHLPAGAVSFAIGGEHRTERADDVPDALTASSQTYGAINFGPTNGVRDVWSIYWEVLVPLTSPSWNVPGLYSLELGYQERSETFSDFGTAERPKFLFRWQPLGSSLTFRGSYTEAYHAPTLSDLFRGALPSAVSIVDPKSPATEAEVVAQSSGSPDLQPETAYQWTYGFVLTPGKWWPALQGLTLNADFYHIDIRGVTVQLDPQFLVDNEKQFPGQVIRGPSTGPNDPFGPIVLLLLPKENLGRMIEEGWDYEVSYLFETRRLGHGDWGALTATLNGTYVDRVVLQSVVGGPEQVVVGKFGGGFLGTNAGGAFTHNRFYTSLFYDGPVGTWLGGVDAGLTMHYTGQYWDNKSFTFDGNARKVREWITLDCIFNYTFTFATPPGVADVAGGNKDGGKNVRLTNGKEQKNLPISTAQFNACSWRGWLNNLTVTFGINNVTGEEPPYVAAAFENGYDGSSANIRGRVWYVALKKRF